MVRVGGANACMPCRCGFVYKVAHLVEHVGVDDAQADLVRVGDGPERLKLVPEEHVVGRPRLARVGRHQALRVVPAEVEGDALDTLLERVLVQPWVE